MLNFLGNYIILIIQTTSYAGIFFFMFLESALIPIPSEITMPFAGFLASEGKLNLLLVIIDGTIANLVGSLLAYYLGYALQENVVESLITKYGKFILLSNREYIHAMEWFRKYGDKIVFFSRLLPGIRTVISLPAGLSEMGIKKFITYTVVGCFLWSSLLAYIGYVLGQHWETIHTYYSKFELVVLLATVFAIAFYIYKKRKK